MIADALAVIDFLQKNKERYTTISAMFDPSGQRIEGSDKIYIEVIPVEGAPGKWYYRVKSVEGYVFIKVPVEPCHIDYGTLHGTTNPTPEYFRFTASALATFSTKNNNLAISFSVVGYKPKQILDRLEER